MYNLNDKSVSMWRTGNVARMEEKRNAHRNLMGKSQGKRSSKDLDVGGRIISKWIFER
jgi:hypothetical protein